MMHYINPHTLPLHLSQYVARVSATSVTVCRQSVSYICHSMSAECQLHMSQYVSRVSATSVTVCRQSVSNKVDQWFVADDVTGCDHRPIIAKLSSLECLVKGVRLSYVNCETCSFRDFFPMKHLK